MPEYAVLDKDTIKIWIMPYLSVAKRGFTSKFYLLEIVNAILYKLKSGCQWRFLPLGHLFSGEAPSWNTVFQHYRKWCKKDEWRKAYANVLSRNKEAIDLSLSHIDGSHTPALRGGECVDLTDMTSGSRLTPTESSPTYVPTGGTGDSRRRKGSLTRLCIRRDGRSRGPTHGSMDSRTCLCASIPPFPAGKVGIFSPL